jgi:hypothetical protein
MKLMSKFGVLPLALASGFLLEGSVAANAQCLPGYYCGPATRYYPGVPARPPDFVIRGRPIMGPMPNTTPMYIPRRQCYQSSARDRYGNPYVICY